MEIQTPTGWVPTQALMDSGSDVSIISPLFAKEHGLELAQESPFKAAAVDGREVHVYGAGVVPVRVTDYHRQVTQQQQRFCSVTLLGVDVLLGMDWISTVNP
jgi:hypothetical protein